MNIESKKIRKFAGRINLGLIDGFALPQHCSRVNPLPPRPCNQVGCFQKDRSPMFPRKRIPLRLCIHSGIDGSFQFTFTRY
jgi:hypothetical protein